MNFMNIERTIHQLFGAARAFPSCHYSHRPYIFLLHEYLSALNNFFFLSLLFFQLLLDVLVRVFTFMFGFQCINTNCSFSSQLFFLILVSLTEYIFIAVILFSNDFHFFQGHELSKIIIFFFILWLFTGDCSVNGNAGV